MTPFAIQMNELELGIAPTDSRNRLDIHYLEQADLDKASEFKSKYEQGQRLRRKSNGSENQHTPCYFTKKVHPITGENLHFTNNTYWDCKSEQKWRCPIDIFKLPSSPIDKRPSE